MKRAFTLPEMLVVIAVIVVLIAILLPLVGTVREAANQLICMSRLRQVAQATIMYCTDNEGSFPGNGNGAGQTGPTLAATAYVPFDWIFWDTNAPAPFNDLTKSALAKYMDLANGNVFCCPSDSLYRPFPNPAHAGESTYNYSFSFNCDLGNSFPLSDTTAPWPGAYFGPRFGSADVDLKMGQVKKPANVIMFIDEDERTVNDGAWVVWSGSAPDRLATRHDVFKDPNDPTGRGNVVFCDGHGEFVTRQFTFNPSSYQPY